MEPIAITNYALAFYGKQKGSNKHTATIEFFDSKKKHLGRIYFQKNRKDTKPTIYDKGLIYLYMHENQFQSVADMFRNEKPIYLWYNSPTDAYISTFHEPTGEEEAE